jgi:S-adenosylmethionine-diacylgycerolhomoserine-N-methlytransferase
LEVARWRAAARGWSNVEVVRGDATSFRPVEAAADVVTFSYALTMIPDWYAAVANAEAMLRPGGTIGVADFYVSRKHPAAGMTCHGLPTRTFWPLWFGIDNVFLSPDHLPLLRHRFETVSLGEARSRVPYTPFGKVPYYTFLGKKPAARSTDYDAPRR